MVALIPARAGSKRCPGKNTRLLAGHPLIAYTIAAAKESGVFSKVQVWSDAPVLCWWVFEACGVPGYARPTSADTEPDIRWVTWALDAACNRDRPESFAILRPTSPFRTAATIQRAYAQFQRQCPVGNSLRAVEPVKQTPYKMWVPSQHSGCMVPLLDAESPDAPLHSTPTQTHPPVWIQNGSLEMSWAWNVTEIGTIHGITAWPFFTEGHEGFDINTEADFAEAERLAAVHPELLPRIGVAA